MALDKLVDSTKLDACMTAEANAIRAKTGGTDPIPYDYANNKGFADAIEEIETGATITDGIVIKARDANGYATEVDFYNDDGVVPINQFMGGSSSPWYKLAKINVVPEGVIVKANSFRGLTNLQDVAAAAVFEKVVEISGNYAFHACSAITTAIFSKCQSINGNQIFRYCSALQTVRFPVCESVTTGSNEDGVVAYVNSLTELVVGSIGHPYAPVHNGHFLYNNNNASLVATFFVGSGAKVDSVLKAERKGSVQTATIVMKAANALEYNGTSYAAGDTILTSEVTS